MTDFSKLFTDPDAQVYQADPGEAAQWQAANTNPFATLHALAARRNNQSRHDDYAAALAAHDARAQSGAKDLMDTEFKYNMPIELAKVKLLDPSFGLDLAGLARMQNGEVDPRVTRTSDDYQAQNRANAIRDFGAGEASLGSVGLRPTNDSGYSRNFLHLGDLRTVATPEERAQAAKAQSDLDTTTVTETPILPDGADENIAIVRKFKNADRAAAAVNEVRNRAGKVHPPGGNVHTNAGGKTTPPPAAPTPTIPPPGPVRSGAELNTLPVTQKQTIEALRTGAVAELKGGKIVPNSFAHDGQGNIALTVDVVQNGKTVHRKVFIRPDGRYALGN